jgi:peptidoglycan/xylan/chitin deacetylase (PgdA/CDA1 family)
MPPSCRREGAVVFLLSLLPASGVIAALMLGHPVVAALIFGITFSVIGVGSVVPRCRWFGAHVSRLPDGVRGVCLTIDDGPDPQTTPVLLDILDEHQAKALFFVIGSKALRHPELVCEMERRGHAVGNHSQTHPAACFWALPPWQLWHELAGCQQSLQSILGRAPLWFRPPVGHHNFFLLPVLRALGLTMMIWNCRGFDGVKRDPGRILKALGNGLAPGSIVLLHDATPVCVEVLRGTLELIRSHGLVVEPPPAPGGKKRDPHLFHGAPEKRW